jgi:hypothetical protein
VDLELRSENLEGEYSGLEHEVVEGVVESLKVRGSVICYKGARVCATNEGLARPCAPRLPGLCACSRPARPACGGSSLQLASGRAPAQLPRGGPRPARAALNLDLYPHTLQPGPRTP